MVNFIERELVDLYFYICLDKEKDMSICPDCEFCAYFYVAPEMYQLYMGKIPSSYTEDYWIYAFSPTNKGEEISSVQLRLKKKVQMMKNNRLRTGKWKYFVSRDRVDEMWNKIKRATEKGLLGIESKVSTTKPKNVKVGHEKGTHVICIYTYDWTDKKDVKRVRNELRKLGVINRIPYKTDEDTIKGKYTSKGSKGISKFYE